MEMCHKLLSGTSMDRSSVPLNTVLLGKAAWLGCCSPALLLSIS